MASTAGRCHVLVACYCQRHWRGGARADGLPMANTTGLQGVPGPERDGVGDALQLLQQRLLRARQNVHGVRLFEDGRDRLRGLRRHSGARLQCDLPNMASQPGTEHPLILV